MDSSQWMRTVVRIAGLQVLQGKVWVWGQGGASAEQDGRLVKPALIAELEDQWPPRGHDEQPWDLFGAQYMRALPYGRPRLASCLHIPYCCHLPDLCCAHGSTIPGQHNSLRVCTGAESVQGMAESDGP